jgi:amino-acid N-acetyltransferase
MNKKYEIRKARIAEAEKIRDMVNVFASQGKMLPLSLNQIYERLRDFLVIYAGRDFIGCGALKITWKDLGEIRSTAIAEKYQNQGYGRLLVEKLLLEAEQMELKKVFVLTYYPEFFGKFGFKKIEKSKLPHKIWVDCINCPKFPNCDEIALLKKL